MFLDIYYLFSSDVYSQVILKERALHIWTNNEENILKEVVKITLDILIYQSLARIDKGGNIKIHNQI